MVVGECRKKVRPVERDALVHGAGEGLQRPAADAGLRVGREVRRIDGPYRGAQRIAASKWLAALPSVARGTMSGCGEYLSFGDRLSWKVRSARGLDGRNRRPPSQKEEAQQSEDSRGDNRDRDAPNQCILHWLGYSLAKAAALLRTEPPTLSTTDIVAPCALSVDRSAH